MAGRPRLPTQTPRSRRGSPRTPTVLEQAQMLLLAQTQAIASLQQQLAMQPTRHLPAPRLSAPEKCDVEMSTAAFRSWRRSMQCWLDLNEWAPTEAVLHIRLHCTPTLQRSLDAKFTAVEWQALTVHEALDAISRIALQATNQAADWCKFFTASQERGESISSSCPPLVAGLLRCYNMKFCPFAQRVCIILAAKNIKHEIVNINLKNKPEWYFQKNPLGKVPSLELNGEVMIESLVICDYLDEVYPSPPLYPTDPWKKGQDRMFLEIFGKVTGSLYKVYFARGEQKILSQGMDDIRAGLDVFEAELTKRNTKYYFGEAPGMLDYMIWPWMERLPVCQKFAAEFGSLPKDRYPKLFSWMDLMKEDAAVKATYLSPETHYKYLQTSLSGSPDYDMQV